MKSALLQLTFTGAGPPVRSAPLDRLVPVVMMQNYKSIPDHLTEDDILSNIKQMEEDILEERIPNTRSKKRDSFFQDILLHPAEMLTGVAA